MNYVTHNPVESIAHALFRPMGIGGVYARTGLFERVIDGLTALISRYRPCDADIFKFREPTEKARSTSTPIESSSSFQACCTKCEQARTYRTICSFVAHLDAHECANSVSSRGLVTENDFSILINFRRDNAFMLHNVGPCRKYRLAIRRQKC
jgi:hypothetical protein